MRAGGRRVLFATVRNVDEHPVGFGAAAVPVHRELLRLCGGDRARAEDLVQDTFERAARHLGRNPDRSVAVGW